MANSNRVIVTGSRDFPHWASQYVYDVLLDLTRPGEALVHGAARGLDTIVDILAGLLGNKTDPHPAKWQSADGRTNLAAGTERNLEMAKLGARLCLGFLIDWAPCKGTMHMLRTAHEHGIPTQAYELRTTGEFEALGSYEDLLRVRQSRAAERLHQPTIGEGARPLSRLLEEAHQGSR